MVTLSRWTAVLIAAVAASCASFRSDERALAGEAPRVDRAASRSIEIVLVASRIENGTSHAVPVARLAQMTELSLSAYQQTGLFSRVSGVIDGADLRAEISLRIEEQFVPLLVAMSGATLSAIPSWSTNRFTVRTVFKDREGRVLGTYEENAQVTLWIHALLLPLTPFLFPAEVERGVQADLHSFVIREALRDGVL